MFKNVGQHFFTSNMLCQHVASTAKYTNMLVAMLASMLVRFAASLKTSLSQSYKGGQSLFSSSIWLAPCLYIIFCVYYLYYIFLQILYKMILDRIYFYLLRRRQFDYLVCGQIIGRNRVGRSAK